MSFHAGDVVRHAPSGETWRLACDEDRGSVMPLGWPESRVHARECTMVKAASYEERLATLRGVIGGAGDTGYRGALAREQLAILDPVYACARADEDLVDLVASVRSLALRIAAHRMRHGRNFIRNRPCGELLDLIDTKVNGDTTP